MPAKSIFEPQRTSFLRAAIVMHIAFISFLDSRALVCFLFLRRITMKFYASYQNLPHIPNGQVDAYPPPYFTVSTNAFPLRFCTHVDDLFSSSLYISYTYISLCWSFVTSYLPALYTWHCVSFDFQYISSLPFESLLRFLSLYHSPQFLISRCTECQPHDSFWLRADAITSPPR